jgi:hypothetical protein
MSGWTRAFLTVLVAAGGAASCAGSISDVGGEPGGPGAGPAGGPGQAGGGAAPAGEGAGPAGAEAQPGASGAPAAGASPAAPGGPAAASPPACRQAAVPSSPRLWRLDDAQYAKTVAVLLAGRSRDANDDLKMPTGLELPLAILATGDVKFSTLSSLRNVDADDAEDLAYAAHDVSERLIAGTPALLACVNGCGPLRACLEAPLVQKAELAFRRPVAAADVAHYLAAADAEASLGRREAARLALKAILISPRLVFRAELGATQPSGRARLDAFEIAEALSYSLTDGPPDQPLWTDAQSGALLDPAAIGRHVTRLLAAAERKGPVRKFVRELFAYRATLGIVKSGSAFHRPASLIAEADLFVDGVLRTNAHRDFLKELLAGRAGLVSSGTAPSYNAALPAPSTTPVPWSFTGERQGLLGHPAWLSSYSQPERNDPVARGRFVFERLLCGTVPDAPIEDIPEIPPDPRRTLRERFAIHTQNPSCRACHAMMDDIGLALEGFDHFGRMRDTEAGRPVNRAGFLRGSGDQDAAVDGLGGLVTRLLASERTTACLASQAFEFFMGRAPAAGDACTLEDARARYASAGGDLAALVQAFFVSEGFLSRAR